ncbi:MAG: hypothetical protein ACRCZQ_01485 [Bacteroidales bacterium]
MQKIIYLLQYVLIYMALIMIRENNIPENRSDFDKKLDSLFKEMLLHKVKCKDKLNQERVDTCVNSFTGMDIEKFVSVSPESIVSVLKSNHTMSDASMERLADLIVNITDGFDCNLKSLLSERTKAIYTYVDEQYLLAIKR